MKASAEDPSGIRAARLALLRLPPDPSREYQSAIFTRASRNKSGIDARPAQKAAATQPMIGLPRLIHATAYALTKTSREQSRAISITRRHILSILQLARVPLRGLFFGFAPAPTRTPRTSTRSCRAKTERSVVACCAERARLGAARLKLEAGRALRLWVQNPRQPKTCRRRSEGCSDFTPTALDRRLLLRRRAMVGGAGCALHDDQDFPDSLAPRPVCPR